MARIVGVDIPDNKKIEYALPYVQGIGLSLSRKILKQARVDPNLRTKDLSDQEISLINQIIEKNFVVEGELQRRIRENIKRLVDIGTYRGTRHKKGLPVRGQRTRHNARTRKGRRRLAVAGLSSKKKAALAKT